MNNPSTSCLRGSALAAIALLPWLVIPGLLRPTPARAQPPAVAATDAPLDRSDYAVGQPGPWGQLRTTRILIEPPEEFVPSLFVTPQPLQWTFRGFDLAKLAALWDRAGLSAPQRELLDRPELRRVDQRGVVVRPTGELVLGLSEESRATIYAVLAQFPENLMQRDPFRLRTTFSDDWFDTSLLPAEVIALTKRLLYRRDANLLFSDHDLVLPRLGSASARVTFIKILSRKSSLLVDLIVPPGADTEALTSYWARGRRNKDIGALLSSLARRPGGGTIDIVHLLPPFARRYLYTFPVPTGRPDDAARDCHWTSLNFFAEPPGERFLETSRVIQTLVREYQRVTGPPKLGDIVLLVDPREQGVHSCVYIAENIVFTKNGAAFSVPWQLARLDNVIAFYQHRGPLEVRRYRAR